MNRTETGNLLRSTDGSRPYAFHPKRFQGRFGHSPIVAFSANNTFYIFSRCRKGKVRFFRPWPLRERVRLFSQPPENSRMIPQRNPGSSLFPFHRGNRFPSEPWRRETGLAVFVCYRFVSLPFLLLDPVVFRIYFPKRSVFDFLLSQNDCSSATGSCLLYTPAIQGQPDRSETNISSVSTKSFEPPK
jgi:hypothetical protein